MGKIKYIIERYSLDIHDYTNRHLINQKKYNSNSQIVSEIIDVGYNEYKYFYDKDSKLVKKKWKFSNFDLQTFEYLYGEDGKIQEELWYEKPLGYKDGRPISKKYFYYENGLLHENLCDHRDIGFYTRNVFEYDERHNLIREKGYRSNGIIRFLNEWIYSKDNFLIEEKKYSDGSLYYYRTIKYNNGKIESEHIEPAIGQSDLIYEYKEDNNIIIKEYNNKGNLVRVLNEVKIYL